MTSGSTHPSQPARPAIANTNIASLPPNVVGIDGASEMLNTPAHTRFGIIDVAGAESPFEFGLQRILDGIEQYQRGGGRGQTT